METASSCGGVRHKRYSEQLEKAPKKKSHNPSPISFYIIFFLYFAGKTKQYNNKALL